MHPHLFKKFPSKSRPKKWPTQQTREQARYTIQVSAMA